MNSADQRDNSDGAPTGSSPIDKVVDHPNNTHKEAGTVVLAVAWWILLLVFASAGKGTLGVIWFLATLPFFVLHHSALIPEGTTVKWDETAGLKFFGILSAAILYTFAFTCFTWSVGFQEGVFSSAKQAMFYVIAFAFVPLSMFAMFGMITFVFARTEKKYAIYGWLFAMIAVLLPSALNLLFPHWVFTKAVDELGLKATWFGAGMSFFSWLGWIVYQKSVAVRARKAAIK
jgi:hypothetical protein